MSTPAAVDAAVEAAAKDVTSHRAQRLAAAELRERLAPVVEHAIQTARLQGAHAAVAAGHAREWATPRIVAAVEKGRAAAAPTVEAAANRLTPAMDAARERMTPAMEAARDRIVDDLLPRLIDAVDHATATGIATAAAAGETVSRSVEDAARSIADATPTAKARRRRRRTRVRVLALGLFAAVAAVIAAAAARRVQQQQASWELAPTATATTGTDATALDVVAAAAGPSDAGVAEPVTLEEPLGGEAPPPTSATVDEAGTTTLEIDATAERPAEPPTSTGTGEAPSDTSEQPSGQVQR